MARLAFVTTGDTRPMPPPPGGIGGSLHPNATRSGVYRRYATQLVGQRNVLHASDALRFNGTIELEAARS